MSECQYYEFAVLDRPLTPQQQAELRKRSSRATITATSFINEYHWGNLKGVRWTGCGAISMPMSIRPAGVRAA